MHHENIAKFRFLIKCGIEFDLSLFSVKLMYGVLKSIRKLVYIEFGAFFLIVAVLEKILVDQGYLAEFIHTLPLHFCCLLDLPFAETFLVDSFLLQIFNKWFIDLLSLLDTSSCFHQISDILISYIIWRHEIFQLVMWEQFIAVFFEQV